MYKVLLLIIVLISISSSTISSQTYKTTQDGYLAAITEDLLDKAMDLVSAKDYVALQKLMDTGAVFWLKEGLKVQIVEHGSLGIIKISRSMDTLGSSKIRHKKRQY